MNEQDLMREFDAVLAGEPPLGFDPAEVVTRTGRRRRRRWASALAGAGVVLVAVAAPLIREPQAVPSAPPVEVMVWPRATPPQLTDEQILARVPNLSAHFRGALPQVVLGGRVLPDPVDFTPVTTGGFTGKLPVPMRGFSVAAMFDTGVGTAAPVVSVLVPSSAFPMDQVCAVAEQARKFGNTVTCQLSPVAGGGFLVVVDNRADGLQRSHMVSVGNFRPDGSLVMAESTSSASVVLTVDQLTKLATDPAFALK